MYYIAAKEEEKKKEGKYGNMQSSVQGLSLKSFTSTFLWEGVLWNHQHFMSKQINTSWHFAISITRTSFKQVSNPLSKIFPFPLILTIECVTTGPQPLSGTAIQQRDKTYSCYGCTQTLTSPAENVFRLMWTTEQRMLHSYQTQHPDGDVKVCCTTQPGGGSGP